MMDIVKILTGRSGEVVNESHIHNFCKGKEYVYVVVYANWCGHCKTMIRTLGPDFKQYEKLIFLESETVPDNYVNAFPTCYKYQNGKRYNASVDDIYALFDD